MTDLQEQIPDAAPDFRAEAHARALEEGLGMGLYAVRGMVSEQLALDITVAAASVPPSRRAPRQKPQRGPRRPPKYEATDRDVEDAALRRGDYPMEPDYVPNPNGSGIALARQIAANIGSRSALRHALEHDASANEYPGIMAAQAARHQRAVEKPFLQ